MALTDHAVVIAGAGPTGLMLAGELALANVDVAIVERRATQEVAGSRAGGLHARTLEALDQRGIVHRFLAAGQVAQVAGFAHIPLHMRDLPTRFNHGLALRQRYIERLLAEWVEELQVPIYRSVQVEGFTQDASGVTVALSGDRSLRAEYLVGCDGGRSQTRKVAGIDFVGWDATTSSLLAEVETTRMPQLGIHRDAIGVHAFSRAEYEIRDGEVIYKDHGPLLVMVSERHVRQGQPTRQDLSEALTAVYGTDYGVRSASWISRFTDMTRQASSYRKGRVLLAGDAAHIHSPVGGQGLNIGVQDAVNLGWKLAQVVQRRSPESLLDTYHAERHPVAARVLRNTMAQVALLRTDDRTEALREVASELLGMDRPRRTLAAEMSGLAVRYHLGDGHPLVGRRMPDLDLETAAGPRRVFTLLHEARPLLLHLAERGTTDITPWANRVRVVRARYGGVWDLPDVGAVEPPGSVLVRPDGYVAWVGDGGGGLAEALTAWCGAPPNA